LDDEVCKFLGGIRELKERIESIEFKVRQRLNGNIDIETEIKVEQVKEESDVPDYIGYNDDEDRDPLVDDDEDVDNNITFVDSSKHYDSTNTLLGMELYPLAKPIDDGKKFMKKTWFLNNTSQTVFDLTLQRDWVELDDGVSEPQLHRKRLPFGPRSRKRKAESTEEFNDPTTPVLNSKR
jgi:hypothetical protein